MGDPALEVAPSDLDFGVFQPGDALDYGTPPQGGAPYSPYHLRTTGLQDPGEGVVVDLWAVDTDDGSDLGSVQYDVRLICANVGDSAGWWVGSDVHMRFEGWSLDDLEGRSAELGVEVSDLHGGSVSTSIDGVLTRM